MRAPTQLLTLAMLLLAGTVQAGPVLALRADTPESAALAACVGARLAAAGFSLEPAPRMPSGLEARIALHPLMPPAASVALSLKPAPELLAHDHDDDPEAHPEIVARLRNRLRIPLATRVWSLGPGTPDPCPDIADWLVHTGSRPVLLDRLPD